MDTLTRNNPRYRGYLDTEDCFQLTKECPSVYGGYDVVEGFEYTKIGIDGILYYGVSPMTRCTLATTFIGKSGMTQHCFYDAATDQPEYEDMCHRTVKPFYDMGIDRIRPLFDATRTVARDCDHYTSFRSIGIESVPKDRVCDCNTYYHESEYIVDEDE